MIIVNAAMKQDVIQTTLENAGYKFEKKQGMQLYFEPAENTTVADAKALLKAEKSLVGVFFNLEEK